MEAYRLLHAHSSPTKTSRISCANDGVSNVTVLFIKSDHMQPAFPIQITTMLACPWLLPHIMHYLSWEETAGVKRVSSHWCQAVDTSMSWRRTVNLTDNSVWQKTPWTLDDEAHRTAFVVHHCRQLRSFQCQSSVVVQRLAVRNSRLVYPCDVQDAWWGRQLE